MKSVEKVLLILVIASPAVFLTGLLIQQPRIDAPGSPAVEILPRRIRIETKPDDRAFSASVKILNTGQGELRLGDVRTSCGCVVSEIQPRRIKPGGQASLTVEGVPPERGERLVIVEVEANTREGWLQLPITVVGSLAVPYVVATSGPVRFGEMRPGVTYQETVFVETRESADEPPWLRQVSDPDGGLVIVGGLSRETPSADGLVTRRYEYEVTTEARRDLRELRTVVAFHDPNDPGRDVLQLDVAGVVQPVVSLTPAILTFNRSASTSPTHQTCVVTCREPGHELTLGVSPIPEPFEVSFSKLDARRVLVRVGIRDPSEAPPRATIGFTTNHPEAESLELTILSGMNHQL